MKHRGNLSDISTCEVLASLCREEATGVLTFRQAPTEKSVYLQKGHIVFAASRDAEDRLGELLFTRGVITREQMAQASTQVGKGKRLGTVLVEMGFLPASDLPRWVREQVKEIVFSLFPWGEGEYLFEAGPLPSGEVITLRISNAEIFLTGLRRVQKWPVLRKGAGEFQVSYRLAPNGRQLLKDVQLDKDEEALLRMLESGSNTMEQAVRNSSLTTLFVYQVFFAFRVLGVLIPEEKAGQVNEASPEQLPARTAASATAPAVEVAPAVAPADAVPAVTGGGVSPHATPLPSAQAPKQSVAGAEHEPESVPLAPVKEVSSPSPGAVPHPDPGAQTVMLKITPAPASPDAQAAGPAPALPSSRKKREYKVVRVEGEKLAENGTSQIEDLLGTWSRKGFSLAGVIPGKGSSLFSSSPPSFFIFIRD